MKTSKKFATLLLTAVVSMGLSSCNKLYYQVYDVNSENMVQKDNSLVYENNDLKLMYNLWGENGSVGFIIQNKTNNDLFIDLTQTFFILNGKANDYFKNREFTKTSINEASLSAFYISNWSNNLWTNRYYVPVTAKVSKGASTGITTKEKAIICIPANSWKVIDEYKVVPSIKQTCDKKTDYPKHKAVVSTYNKDNSPLTFRNRISYAFDKECKNLKQIENEFYVSDITNYSKKEIIQTVKEKVNCYDIIKTKRKYFKIGGPNKFYVTYNKKNR